VFGKGRGTYSIFLRFPTGYFDPEENERDDVALKGTDRGGNWHLKSLGDCIQYLRTMEEKAPTISFPKSTVPTIYATVPYREMAFGKIQPERLPVVGGEFPYVFVEGKSGTPTPFKYQEVVRFETQHGDEIEVLWAEIQRNEQAITPRFLQLSYEVIDGLIDQAIGAGESDSLKAVLYHSDGQTIRYVMQLQVTAP
jgi:hypothetical protein